MNQFPLTVLLMLDGFGYNPETYGNAIYNAHTPNLDYLWSHYPRFLLKAAEEEVGLEFGEIGNSEVGHMTIGTGRVIPQSLNRINKALQEGSFYQNPAFLTAINQVKQAQSQLHLLGIISTAGVHGHLFHYLSLLRLAAQHGLTKVYLHLITDGRDAGKYDTPLFLREIDKVKAETGVGSYASMTGRAFTMDRNNNWEKTNQGLLALLGQGEQQYPDPHAAIQAYYQQKIDDENLPPTVFSQGNAGPVRLQPHDAIIFSNFREDRARQITQALSLADFDQYQRPPLPDNICLVTMSEYQKGLPVEVAFAPPSIANPYSDILGQYHISQIHIAETEKYAHVTYFFNGGREQKIPMEEFFMIPSLTPEEFETTPQMSAGGVSQAILQSIELGYQAIIANFANCDMVGHTGNYQATVTAVEYVDQMIGQITKTVTDKNGYFFLTADHGNAEQMIDPNSGTIYKKHTISPVPFIVSHPSLFTSNEKTEKIMAGGQIAGLLSDVAPTILETQSLPIPLEMSGTSLL